MATRKITQLTELAEAPHDDDEFIIVDVSDTTMSPEGTNKRLKASNLPTGGGGAGIEIVSIGVSVDNAAVLAMKYNNTPVTLKAAEAGKIIMPVSLLVVATQAGATESSSDNLQIGWDAATSTTGQYYFYSRDWMNGVASGTRTSFSGGPDNAASPNMYDISLVNQPFQAWCTDVFNGGWSMKIYLNYYMMDE